MARDEEVAFKPTASQTSGYSARKIAEATNGADIAIAGINSSGAVLRELLAVAKSNPIIGVVISAILANVLWRAKIIDNGTYEFVNVMIGTAFGVTVALDIEQGVLNVLGLGGGQNENLIAPVATTLVENPPAAANASTPNRGGGIGALISKIAGSGEVAGG